MSDKDRKARREASRTQGRQYLNREQIRERIRAYKALCSEDIRAVKSRRGN